MATYVSRTGLVAKVQWSVRTTDATSTLLQWLNLPAAGAGASFNANLYAQQDNGQRAFNQTYVGQVNRNGTGTGAGLTISVGPGGYVDPAAIPWTTPGAPAGWNGTPIDLSASPTISFQVQGVAATNIDWFFVLNDVSLFGGATLLNT